MSAEQSERVSESTPTKETRGVQGRVSEMRQKFDNGQKASTPVDAERRRKEAQKAKAIAARYNMMLRGQMMMEQKRRQSMANHVNFLPHEFTEEWEEYPWHLAAAFTDEDDAFWMPELALALEQEDEQEINRAVLRFFLEENDPDRVDEIDNLLIQFAGSEEVLFANLQNEYVAPDLPQPPVREPEANTQDGEEEKSAEPPAPRRRASYLVTGVRRASGWALNAADEELKQKMAESGADSEIVETVSSVAAANQLEPFAPGGTE